MTTIKCELHNIDTEVFEIGEERLFIDDNADKNAIFKSMETPKRISRECNNCEWLVNKAIELYEH